jgi:hypothetical protein
MTRFVVGDDRSQSGLGDRGGVGIYGQRPQLIAALTAWVRRCDSMPVRLMP